MADESQFPMTDRVKALLDQGKEREARALAQAQEDSWMKKAQSGHLMNLSDLIAQKELLVIHEIDKHAAGSLDRWVPAQQKGKTS